MADYWKSTPRYWCKHCKLYVRDTPIEKRNHEASPRHQGNLQRFLKELHRNNDRESREAQRAKDEVARLKGQYTGSTGDSSSGRAITFVAASAKNSQPTATVEDRRRQMAQLAAMGVVVPNEFRKENAMVGGWEFVSKPGVQSAHDENGSAGPDSGLSIDRKSRDFADSGPPPEVLNQKIDEHVDSAPRGGKRKPVWGSDIRVHGDTESAQDLESLLYKTSVIKARAKRSEGDANTEELSTGDGTDGPELAHSIVKQEAHQETVNAVPPGEASKIGKETPSGQEIDDELNAVGSLFKRRRTRNQSNQDRPH